MKNIGLLLPKSTTHPQLGYDFFFGIKGALEHHGNTDLQIHTSNIGFGTDTDLLYAEAEKLFLEKSADILLVFADHPKVDVLFPLAVNLGKQMVVVNSSAKYPIQWKGPENILFLSLNEMISSLLLGELNSGGVPCIFASSFYDGGYAFGDTFYTAFTDNGGTIEYTFIGQPAGQAFDPTPLTSFLAEKNKSFNLFSAFTSPVSRKYLDAVKPFAGQVSLMASASMWNEIQADPTALNAQLPEITACSSWNPQLENEQHGALKKFLTDQVSRRESAFSALGWDAGLLLSHLMMVLASSEPASWPSFKQALSTQSFTGCRGEMVFHPETHHFLAPQYFFHLQNQDVTVTPVSALEVSRKWDTLMRTKEPPPQTGWFNTYLCS